MTTKLTANLIWGVLLLLTLVSWSLGELNHLGLATALLIGAITLGKGWLVADFFMGLKASGGLFRWLVVGWLVLVIGLIAIAYHIPG